MLWDIPFNNQALAAEIREVCFQVLTVPAVRKLFEISGRYGAEFPDINHRANFRASESIGSVAVLVCLSRLDGTTLSCSYFLALVRARLVFRTASPALVLASLIALLATFVFARFPRRVARRAHFIG